MADFKQIATKLWDDKSFHDLTERERLVYLYCKTNKHMSVAGCCKLPLELMAVECGLDVGDMVATVSDLEEKGKIMHRDGWLAVRDANDSQLKGPKIKAAIDAAVSAAPEWVGAFVAAGTEKDPRVLHPAIQAVRDLLERYPGKDTWDAIIETVGDEPDYERMAEAYMWWSRKGYRPTNLNWLFEWFIKGVPQYITNGKTKQTNSEIAAEYAAAFNSDGPRLIG